jgi:uncharacterized protein (TIGR02266 family)
MSGSRKDSKMIRAVRPAAMAKEMLGQALGQLQDIKEGRVEVEAIGELIAKAIGALYAVQSSEPEEPAHVAGVQQAMAHLSQCLEKLQNVRARGTAVDNATATLARTLAILYPVSRVQQKGPLPDLPQRPSALPHDPRRITQRSIFEVDIGFQSETNFYTGFSQDVSEGGIFIATYNVLERGTRMAVSFTLPDGHLVSCQGVVRWTREHNPSSPDISPGMGVQFERLSTEDRAAIDRFLAQRPAMFFEE